MEAAENWIYDKEKYKEMILDAAETVLGHFGFDRSVFGWGNIFEIERDSKNKFS